MTITVSLRCTYAASVRVIEVPSTLSSGTSVRCVTLDLLSLTLSHFVSLCLTLSHFVSLSSSLMPHPYLLIPSIARSLPSLTAMALGAAGAILRNSPSCVSAAAAAADAAAAA